MAKGFDGLLKEIKRFGKDLDTVTASLTLAGPTLAAQRVVSDLQEIGPRWTGRFSNSWEIRGPQGQSVRGTGGEGDPVPVVFSSAPFTGQQALRTLTRTFLTTDKVVFTITNFSPYADQARDLVPFTPDEPSQKSPLKPARYGTRPAGGRRGELATGSRSNRATAPLDWYSNYFGGGFLDKTVRVTLDGLNIGFK